MIEPIGESSVRMTTRTDQNLNTGNKEIALQKVEKAVEERPIENSEESTQTDSESNSKSGAYKTDKEGIFFEKYDKQGNVIYRVPPEQKPIDERV